LKAKNTIHVDFESRSIVDLKKTGAHVYAKHPTTDALCMAYAVNDSKVFLWKLGEPFPKVLGEALKREDTIFAAHNAAFEFLIWNDTCAPKYGWPKLPITKLDCTMVRAFSMGLPGTLENAAKAVGLPVEKDMKGHRIMLQLCKPRKMEADGSYSWWEPNDSTPKLDIKAKYEALYKYCIQDIIVERELDKRLLGLTESEKKLWFLDQKINYRGIFLDEPAAQKAIAVVHTEQRRFNKLINELTEGEVSTCNSNLAFKKWIENQGVKCEGVSKSMVLDLLEHTDLPDNVRTALLLRQEASKSSTAKIKSMITSKSEDSRVRGCFQFYGAASTGRWSGRRVQMQNLKRPLIGQDEIDFIMESITKSDFSVDSSIDFLHMFHGSAIDPISDCIRAMLRAAPGKKLVGCDFSAIEGRVLAWLAGEEATLRVYRGDGRIYEHTASQIYRKPIEDITKDERMIGKVANLALGYQGGKGAFQSMARIYGLKMKDKRAQEIKELWRENNPAIVSYWHDVERAALVAVENPKRVVKVGVIGRQISFVKNGSFLFCRLPSGRAICYPYAEVKPVMTPWGQVKVAVRYKGNVFGQFVNRVAYGGLIVENITQATARDLLAEALMRLELRGFPVVIHVHDEAVCEVDVKHKTAKAEIEKAMNELPAWAEGLPIQSEAWEGIRYRK